MRSNVLKMHLLISAWLIGANLIAQSEQVLDAELSTARRTVYLNETVKITLTIRTAGLNLGQDIAVNGMPPESQFIQLGDYREIAPKRETLNGVITSTRRFIGYFRPIATGRLTLSPNLSMTLLTRRASLFGSSVVHHSRHTLKVKPIVLSVISLPTLNIPSGFEGAIGDFSVEANVSPSSVAIGDLINITTIINGQGYLDDITPIAIPVISGFKVYDPKPLDDKANMRSFIQTLVVTSTNTMEIPPVSFSYFDPATAQYKTKRSGPFPLKFHRKQAPEIEHFQPDASPNGTTQSNTYARTAKPPFSRPSIPAKWKKAQTARIIAASESLYFAPSRSSVITLELPANAQVVILETHAQWCKVQYKRNRGWIPAAALNQDIE